MQNRRLVASWNPRTSRANFAVAKDGSRTHRTINEAVAALARMCHRRSQSMIIHVTSSVYEGEVEIHRDIRNVMLVGDGIDRTIVTGSCTVSSEVTPLGAQLQLVSRKLRSNHLVKIYHDQNSWSSIIGL